MWHSSNVEDFAFPTLWKRYDRRSRIPQISAMAKCDPVDDGTVPLNTIQPAALPATRVFLCLHNSYEVHDSRKSISWYGFGARLFMLILLPSQMSWNFEESHAGRPKPKNVLDSPRDNIEPGLCGDPPTDSRVDGTA